MYILIFDNGDYYELHATTFADAIIEARTIYDYNYLIDGDAEIISPNGEHYSFANEKSNFIDLEKDYSE